MGSLEPELSFARELVQRAGEILLHYFGSGFAVEMKSWADPVTVADRESESLIRGELARRFPDDGIDGEEEGRRVGSSGRLWLVDPLDGTADFAGGLPFFAVVLTLIDQREPDRALLNVTYDPIRRETFYGIRGAGAFLDGQPLRIGTCSELPRALINIHFSNQRQIWEASIDLAKRITSAAPHARNLGSSALAQAYVAGGRLDGHAKLTSGMYDVVGGNLLIDEAGGVVTDLAGRPWREHGSLLATNRALHPLLVQQIGNIQVPSYAL